MLNRRGFLTHAGLGAAALAFASRAAAQEAGFTLPKLPYAEDALEPHIDAQTMKIHHDKHHQAYVDNLNKALAGHPELLKRPVEQLLRDINQVPASQRQAVINNGGGHANHTLFWEVMAPGGASAPEGELAKVTPKSRFYSSALYLRGVLRVRAADWHGAQDAFCAIADVKARVRPCPECGNLTEEALCGVCADPRRDRTVICVVEQPVDVLSLERTHEYRGLYHVLGGALSPLDGVEPGDLRIEGLLDRVGADGVEEVVLATNLGRDAELIAERHVVVLPLSDQHHQVGLAVLSYGSVDPFVLEQLRDLLGTALSMPSAAASQ